MAFSTAEMNQLRTQMYNGFVTRSIPRYEMRGAGDGRRSRQVGYRQVTNYNAYNSGLLGRARDAAGIRNVNNDDEIRRIYDFIGGYQSPSAAAATRAAAPSTQGTSSINFSQQLAAIRAQNQASINALTKQMSDQKADYDARELAANKKISNLSSTVANAQSQYDPTRDLGSSNNINPALTIQEKRKSLSSGTQRYNRSQLSINNLNV